MTFDLRNFGDIWPKPTLSDKSPAVWLMYESYMFPRCNFYFISNFAQIISCFASIWTQHKHNHVWSVLSIACVWQYVFSQVCRGDLGAKPRIWVPDINGAKPRYKLSSSECLSATRCNLQFNISQKKDFSLMFLFSWLKHTFKFQHVAKKNVSFLFLPD